MKLRRLYDQTPPSCLIRRYTFFYKKIGIKGLTVTRVKGYGENKSTWSQDWLGAHGRIEIFAEKTKADEIVAAIMEVAHTGGPGDGIICILPAEKIFRIRTKSEVRPEEI